MTQMAYQQAYQTDTGVWVFSREEFRRERWNYSPGEHVLFAGPTQEAGKTTLCFELLEVTATPKLPAYVAVSKPHDPATLKWAKKLDYRIVHDWPASRKVSEIWDGPPPGYVIWPKFGDMNTDVQRCAEITARLLDDRYAAGVRKKHGILVMDDTMIKAKVMGLDRRMVTILTMSGAMGIGIWVAIQKPTQSGDTAVWATSQCSHIFIGRDEEGRNIERYDELGGRDRKLVASIVRGLRQYQFLYIRRGGGMCVVDRD
jgi:hypothetical protein